MSRLVFHSRGTPWSPAWRDDALLIFDQGLSRSKPMGAWIKKFRFRYGVPAGEELKDLRAFPRHIERILKISAEIPNRRLRIVVLGGGSVGDFGGFIASVYKRGVPLLHVPTTWLAAVDSAHGGKNGLNVAGIKNQVGTIHPADEVHLVKTFLATQPSARAFEAAGEVLKIGLLKGGSAARLAWDPARSGESLWKALPTVIAGKMSVVRRDPFEKNGLRHLLNLGHTMGHVFEAELKLPHGLAVAYGLVFAVSFSRAAGLCSEASYRRVIAHPLWGLFVPSPVYLRCLSISSSRIRRLLLQDKKRSGRGMVRFIFVAGMGRPLIREVAVEDLLREVKRQKILLKAWHG